MNIDEILKATDGHTPGGWSIGIGIDYMDNMGPSVQRVIIGTTRGGWDNVYPSRADWALLNNAPALRAEVLRLRERDAAWGWLARNIGDSMKFKAIGVMDNMDGCAEISQVRLNLPQGEPFDSFAWTHEKSVASPKGEPADPVSLAKALGRKGTSA